MAAVCCFYSGFPRYCQVIDPAPGDFVLEYPPYAADQPDLRQAAQTFSFCGLGTKGFIWDLY